MDGQSKKQKLFHDLVASHGKIAPHCSTVDRIESSFTVANPFLRLFGISEYSEPLRLFTMGLIDFDALHLIIVQSAYPRLQEAAMSHGATLQSNLCSRPASSDFWLNFWPSLLNLNELRREEKKITCRS